MKSLQIHIFVDHHATPSTASAQALSPRSSSTSQHQQQLNGELLAAARMVNLQHKPPQQVESGLVNNAKTSGSSREGSVTSSCEDGTEKNIPCDLCGAVLSSRVALRQVSKAVTKESFATCQNLIHGNMTDADALLYIFQHFLTHAAPRPFICRHCDAGFPTNHQLEAHVKLH